MTDGNDEPDLAATEAALLELAAEGLATRASIGDGAIWRLRDGAAVV